MAPQKRRATGPRRQLLACIWCLGTMHLHLYPQMLLSKTNFFDLPSDRTMPNLPKASPTGQRFLASAPDLDNSKQKPGSNLSRRRRAVTPCCKHRLAPRAAHKNPPGSKIERRLAMTLRPKVVQDGRGCGHSQLHFSNFRAITSQGQ